MGKNKGIPKRYNVVSVRKNSGTGEWWVCLPINMVRAFDIKKGDLVQFFKEDGYYNGERDKFIIIRKVYREDFKEILLSP